MVLNCRLDDLKIKADFFLFFIFISILLFGAPENQSSVYAEKLNEAASAVILMGSKKCGTPSLIISACRDSMSTVFILIY